MKSPRILILVLVVLAVAWAAATFYTGTRVETEVARLAETLVARDDVRVTRLDYERGFASGVVHYDLAWSPLPHDPGADALRESGLLPAEGLRVTGTLNVRHGPWTPAAGFAAASTDGEVALPDEARPHLPQYPGQAPLLRVHGELTFDGQIALHARAVDYQGRVLPATGEGAADLALVGLQGTMLTDSRLQRFRVDVGMQEFSLAMQDAEGPSRIALEGLAVTADVTEPLPRLWIGNTGFALERVTLRVPDADFTAAGLSFDSRTWMEGANVQSTSAFGVGALQAGEHNVQSATMTMTLQDVNAVLLSDLVLATERLPELSDREEIEAALGRLAGMLEQLLAGHPVLALESLDVALEAPGDLAGHMRLTVTGTPRVALDALEDMARALRMEAEFRLRKSALRHALGLAMSEHLPSDPVARATELDAMYVETLAGFGAMPFLEISDEHITVRAELRDGMLFVAGAELMDVGGMIGVALGGFARQFDGGPGGGPGGIQGEFPMMVADAEPMFGRVELAADFVPDPFTLQVVAGGGLDLDQVIGHGCVGWVDGAQPDAVLAYEADDFPLYIFVVADDDTTLAVRDPSGRWHCNDDAVDGSGGVNPGLEFLDPQSGEYVIWVGTYGTGSVDAILVFSEVGLFEG